jgi:adenosylcobyric acid synthase
MGITNNKGDHEPFIQSADREDGCKTSDDQVIGTYFHGIFHNDSFRTEYLNTIRNRKGLPPIENRISFNRLREEAFDRLAVHVRKHVDMDVIQQEMENFHQRSLSI